MLDVQDARSIMGATAYGSDGDKIGKVGQVFLDDQTGHPEFVTVNTGLFGTNETFIPVQGASFSGDRLEVPYTKDKVKGAPNVGVDSGHLDESEEQRLYEYYGMGYDTSGPTTDNAMTRSEERVRVGTERREAGRARLRKWIETETETHTVPVTREEAVVEREPITDANVGNATSGPALSEEEHEVILTEEAPVVQKDTVPVERVRLGTQAVTEEQTVTTEVAKERIEVDGDTATTGRTGTTGTTGTTDRI